MDRALRSLSARCSFSYRPGLELPERQHHWPQQLQRRSRSDKLPGSSFSRSHGDRSHPCVRAASQPPRQPGGGGANTDDGDPLPPSEGRIVAALVTSGLSGTLAVLGAALARIDLFGQFRWLSTDDLLLGLASCSGIMALEALLLAPRYDRLLAGAGRQGAKAGAVGLQLRTEHVGELLSADSLAAALVLEQACLVAAQVVRRRGLTQTQPLLEAGLVLVREAAKELLQRGLILTFLAAWLADRAFEAGADDTITLALPVLLDQGGTAVPAAGAGLELYVTDAARYVAGAAVTASVMPLVFTEAEALRLGVASNLALVVVEQQQAEEAAEQRRRRQQEGQLQQLRALEAEDGAGPRSIPGGSRGTEARAAAGGTAGSEAEEAEEEPYDEELDRKETEAMLREYRLYDALGRCASAGPPRLTYALTLLRGLLRFSAPNLTFALTGNLAASLLASALPQLLLLTYVLRGPMVLLERPAAGSQGAPPAG